jgi:hypothetical protein
MFTCVTWHYINYMPLHALIIPLLQGNVGFSCLLTAQCHAANMLNTHETLCCRPTRWMVSGVLPHIDPEIAKYPKNRGNSISFHKVELMAQCSECLLEGWNKTYACCQWSLLIARPDRLMLLLCCPSLMSRRQISCWVTPFLPCVRPITAILGKDPMLRVGDTGTIPFSMCWYKRVYYPGGECDSAADKGDCSRL